MTRYLHGIHDEGGEALHGDKPGWTLITEEIGLNPHAPGRDYTHIANRGIGVIVRLNHAYGSGGTIPLPDKYPQFAAACASWAERSTGVEYYIIGNEPNHEGERPGAVIITPEQYARCFVLCRNAIKQARPGVKVMPAAMAPYHANPTNWLLYLRTVLTFIGQNGRCDAINIHAYTRSSNPDDITSMGKMGPPLQDQFSGFFTYLDALSAAPATMRDLPAFITEFNVLPEWKNENTGVIQAMYAEVNRWNARPDTQKIVGTICFRWLGPPEAQNVHDWEMRNKPQLLEDFRAAVDRGYRSPSPSPKKDQTSSNGEKEKVFMPKLETGTTVTPSTLPPADIDPRAAARGTRVVMPDVAPGQPYWRVQRLYTPDEAESDRLGPDRHVLANVLVSGERQVGVPLLVTWGSGGHNERATITTKHNPNFAFSTDHALTPGDFTIEVADGKPSERVVGIKMGVQTPQGWNPGAHTSTLVDFEMVTEPAVQFPESPVQGTIAYVIALDGAYIRDWSPLGDPLTAVPYGERIRVFRENPAYRQWFKVSYGAVTGWMRGDMFDEKPPAKQFQPNFMPTLVHPIADPKFRFVTQPFGARPEYYKQFSIDGVPLKGHEGIDFGTPIGTLIQAVDDGHVVEVADQGGIGYGRYVKLVHSWGESVYAHMQSPNVIVDQWVTRGQPLGISGNTGNSDGPHLHFGLRINPYNRQDGWGGYVDPAPHLDGRAPSQPDSPTPDYAAILALLKATAQEFGLDWRFVAALAWYESSWIPSASSAAGAMGIMQLMPPTWEEWRVKVGASNPYVARDNIRTGAAYLAWLLKTVGGNEWDAVVAYNFGIGNVLKGVKPPAETIEHASRVIKTFELLEAIGI